MQSVVSFARRVHDSKEELIRTPALSCLAPYEFWVDLILSLTCIEQLDEPVKDVNP